jgi:hypothetical protein
MKRIGEHLGLEEEIAEAARPLEEETDVHRLAKTLEEKLPS